MIDRTRARLWGVLVALVFVLALPVGARASMEIDCLDQNNSPYPASPAHPCPVQTLPSANNGVGALTATTSSATVASLYTGNANNIASWPTSGGSTTYAPVNFYLRNLGATDAAFCARGGTCTCPENGVAATNGVTLQAGGGFGFILVNVLYSEPTIVSCSGSDVVEVDQ